MAVCPMLRLVTSLALLGTLAILPAQAQEQVPAPAAQVQEPTPGSMEAPQPAQAQPQQTTPPAETQEPAPAVPATPAPVAQPAQVEDIPSTPAPADFPDEEAMTSAPAFAHDLSPMGMYMAADWVVKAVMIGLILASVLTWTVWLVKSFQIAGAKQRLRGTLAAISRAASLTEAQGATSRRRGPGRAMLVAAGEETEMSRAALSHSGGDGLKERVSSRLSRIETQAGRSLSRGTGLLATVGSTAPFVGLFGTVWGIMNSFIGIAEAQTTNLAVVAPGIAEALLATALGLVAAIPAVIFYNGFARSIVGYRQGLADAAAAIERLVSRDLDFRRYSTPARVED